MTLTHGTRAAYVKGCKCAPCRAANTHYTKVSVYLKSVGRARPGTRVPSLATIRRLRALVALGYSQKTLASLIGWTAPNLGSLVHERNEKVTKGTADRVEQLYDTLSMTPGGNPRAAEVARRNGWAPPLAWDDSDLTDPRARPSQPRRPNSGIHIDDVRELVAVGYTPERIAWRLGCTRAAIYTVVSRAAS